MKKIFIILAFVLCAVQVVDAQTTVKPAATVKKSVESAEEEVANPKKAENVASWIKLGSAYLEAYKNPKGAGWRGATHQELSLVLGNDKPTSSESVTIGGQNYTKEVYSGRNYYFDDHSVLQIIEVTKPLYDDALMKSADAYRKAYELDVKKTKTKDIKKALEEIWGDFGEDAFQMYLLGNMAEASKCYEAAAKVAEPEPVCEVDSLSIYNAGYTASAAGDLETARRSFERAVEIGYYEKGEAYARLGDIYNKLGNPDKAVEVFEAGFLKFPENQGILVGLIQIYMSTHRDTDKLISYIERAKANDPQNASLYYVEANIYNELGDREKALAGYNETSKVNPEYEFGYIGAGLIYLNDFEEIRNKATAEEDDAKYAKLVEEFMQCLILSGEQLDRAFEVTKNEEVKKQLAEQLKQIYFNLRNQDPKYMAAYEKYNAFVGKK